MSLRHAFATTFLLAVLAWTAPAAAQERVTSVEGVTEYRLPNGLRVVLFPDRSQPTITVNIVYLVGSRHEGYGETGMAHLLEHMLFKGTPRRPKLNEEFGPRGARRNGTTSDDRTNYYETIPATTDNLKWALELEADRMVNSNVARADLDSEMTVVRNEYERGENEPLLVMLKRSGSIAFDWHNYQNSPIGNRSDIENVGIDNLRAFYRMHYQPDNAVLVVAGAFDEAEALRMVVDAFGAIPRPQRTLPKLWTVEPVQDGERTFAVRRVGGVPRVMVAYKVPGVTHPDSHALTYAAQILTAAPSGRLHKRLVESGKAAAVTHYYFQTVDPGLIRFMVTLKPGTRVEDIQAEFVDAIEVFHREPPSAEEMQRNRALLAKGIEDTFNSAENFALSLTQPIAQGDWRLFFQRRNALAQMRAEDVAGAAKRYFVRDNRTVGTFLPTDELMRADLPASPGAQAALKDFKAEEAVAAGEAFDPSPENIEKRTVVRQLPGGLKVALLPKKTRGGTVSVRLMLHQGDERSLQGKGWVPGITSNMLARGTSRYTRQQISDRMDQLKMSGGISAVTSFRTTRANLPEALRLTGHVVREASFPAVEFEQLKAQILANLEQNRSDVGAIATERLARHYNLFPPGDPRYVQSNDESIALVRAMTADDLKAFHREFYGASHAELVVVGDFDEREVMALVEQELGSWKSPRPFAHLARSYRDVVPMNETVRIPDKANAVFGVRMLLPVSADEVKSPDYPALVLANYMFGGGAGPSARLSARMRQREGLTYGVGTGMVGGPLDTVVAFAGSATAAPENMDRIERAFREELDRVHREGFTEEEIAKAKSGLLQQRMQSRSNDESLAGSWADRLHRGRTFAEAAESDARIRALTRDEVNAAARKYLDPSKVSIVRVGTFAK